MERISSEETTATVSYTHLDVYKRQDRAWAASKGRFSRLATSGAFHSPLMAPAQAPFADYLAQVEFREPVVPVIGNVHAAPLDVAGAREELVAHLVSPVQFEASVAKLQAVGAKMLDVYKRQGFFFARRTLSCGKGQEWNLTVPILGCPGHK